MSAILKHFFSSRATPEAMVAAKEVVQKLIDENAVVLFGKSWCGFCHSSRRLLNSIGAEYKDLDLDKRGKFFVLILALTFSPHLPISGGPHSYIVMAENDPSLPGTRSWRYWTRFNG